MDKNLELQLNGVVDDVDLDTPIDFDKIEENSKNLIITFSQLKIPSSSNSRLSSTNVCFLIFQFPENKFTPDYHNLHRNIAPLNLHCLVVPVVLLITINGQSL